MYLNKGKFTSLPSLSMKQTTWKNKSLYLPDEIDEALGPGLGVVDGIGEERADVADGGGRVDVVGSLSGEDLVSGHP